MADRTITVKSAGGDYTTLNAAIQSLVTGGYKNFDSNNGSGAAGKVTIDCYSLGADDTTAVDCGTGWTTSPTNYLIIRGAVSERVWAQTGKWSTSRYRLVPATNSSGIKNLPAYSRIQDLQVKITRDGSETANVIGINCSTANCAVQRCIAVGVVSGTSASFYITTGIYVIDGGLVTDCLAYGFKSGAEVNHSAFSAYTAAATTAEFVNCTAVDSYYGYADWAGGGTVNWKNCGTTGHTTAFYNGTQVAGCKTNAPTFVDAANKDYHLASGDTNWKAQGTTYFASTMCDVDMQTRPVTGWDVGFDQYWAAGERTVSVGPSKAYATLAAALAGEVALFPNLTTNNGTGTTASPSAGKLTFDCYNMVETPTVSLDVTGFTANSTNYITVQGAVSDRTANNTGIYSTERYRIEPSANTQALDISVAYTRVIGLQAKNTFANSGSPITSFLGTATPVYFINCVAVGVVSGSNTGTNDCTGFRCYTGGTNMYCVNCLAYNFKNGSETGHTGFFISTTATTLTCYNCTAYNCYYGFWRSSAGTMVATNCGAASSYSTPFNGTITQTTNSSTSPTFVNAAVNNFHLDAADTVWKDGGAGGSTDLTTQYATLGIDPAIDVDGNPRPSGANTWDIGFDEIYVSANKSLTVDSGPFSVATPSATNLIKGGKTLVPDVASYYLSAPQVNLIRVKNLVVESYNVVITGDISAAYIDFHTDVESHAFGVTGTAITMVKRYGALSPESGSFSLSAPDASNTLWGHKFPAASNPFALNGQPVGMSAPTGRTLLAEPVVFLVYHTELPVFDLKMPLEFTSYYLYSPPITITHSVLKTLSVDSGAFQLTSPPITFSKLAHYVLIPDRNDFILSGTDILDIRYSYYIIPDSGVISVTMNGDLQTHWSNEPKIANKSVKASYVWVVD